MLHGQQNQKVRKETARITGEASAASFCCVGGDFQIGGGEW